MRLELSEKIKCLSLITTMMVVMRHSLNMVAFYQEIDVPFSVSFTELGFSTLTEVAIPFFFIVSGFFFLRYDYYDINVSMLTIKKKFITLFVPFLIWNLVGMLTMYLTGLLHNPESIIGFFQSLLLSEYYGPLWYVRNIMMLMITVPLYYWVFRLNKWWIYLLASVALYSKWLPVDCGWFSTEGVLFFFLGGVLQRYQKLLNFGVKSPIALGLCILWFFLAFFRPYWCMEINKVTTVLGIVAFWLVCDYLPESLKKFFVKIASYSFLVYVLHFFIVKGLKVYIAGFFPQNAAVALICYFGLPMIVFGSLVVFAYWWKSRFPVVYSICVGGRK